MILDLVRIKGKSLRPKLASILTTVLISGLLVSIPVSAFGTPQASPNCAAGVGKGGINSSVNVINTKAGDGCAVIKYISNGNTIYESFNYTGINQSWTVPSGVTSATFYLIGAGGGGAWSRTFDGGGGGFASGTYSLTPGDVLTVIVGQGGGGVAAAAVSGLTGRYTPLTYGGGGRGGTVGSSLIGYASGGGRTAIRLPGATTDLATAAGGGGAGYGVCGYGGGGVEGLGRGTAITGGGRGGTQLIGGAGGTTTNPSNIGQPGTAGIAYLGGDSRDDGGGGGGGYFGGGGGGDNSGGGGGSSYIALLTSGITTSGATCGAAGVSTGLSYTVTYDANGATSGTAPSSSSVTITGSTLTLSSNTGTLAKTSKAFGGWNTAADGSGTSYVVGSTTFIPTRDVTLYAEWFTPSFNADTSAAIGVLGGSSYVINTVYAGTSNDLVLSQFIDRIQIIAVASAGTVAITTTTRLTLPIGYQTALNTAASTISFIGTRADVNAALATLVYKAPATAVTGTIKVYAAHAGVNGDYRYNPTTESSYWRGATTVLWSAAYGATTASSNCGVTFNGMCGYMATPLDATENLFIAEKLGLGWVGILDETQGTWKTVGNAPSGGSTTSYIPFQNGNSSSAAAQYVRIAFANSIWLEAAGTVLANPIYEFGGKAGESATFAAITRTINFGAVSASATPTLATTSDTGSSNSDKKTNDNTPTINVSGLVSGALVRLTATPTSGTAVTCDFNATSTTGSCTFSTLVDGTYSIVAVQTYGGTAAPASTALTGVEINTVRPTVSISTNSFVNGGNVAVSTSAPTLSYTMSAVFSKQITGFVNAEITKAASSTAWAVTGTTFGTTAATSFTFTITNSSGTPAAATAGTPGRLILSIAEGVAEDIYGNTNIAATDFIMNTVVTVIFTNAYQQSPRLNPVVGGSGPASVTQASSGAGITLPGKGLLSRNGYTFAGWSLSLLNGSGEVLTSPYVPTGPVTLYSSWIADAYVVTYNANGGNGAPGVASEIYTFGAAGIAITSSYNVGTLTRTGYTFAGWSTTNSGSAVATTYVPAASITLFARWTAGNFTITFNGNNSTSGTTASSAIDAGTAKALTANSFARVGYTFAGWNSLANGTGTSYANNASTTLFGDTTLYAQWTMVAPGAPSVSAASAGNTTATTTVTPVAESGVTVGPSTSFTVQAFLNNDTIVVGRTCTFLATASPLSCTITGLTNGTIYKFKATATNSTSSATGSFSSMTATPAGFTVTYEPNSGTVSPTSAVFTLGTPLILPLPTRTGYNFTGWNNPSATLVGLNGASYSPPATITLTAQWSAITYTVTYNGNGSDGGSTPANSSFAFGNTFSVAVKGTLTKSGFSFSGWTTSSDGTGTLYANATDSIASSAATYSTSANLILYAKWTPQVYTITYDKNGATGDPNRATDSFTFGTTALTLPTVTGMTYTNYTFGGWSESATGTAVISPYSPTQTRTLYAVWNGISHSVSYNANGGTGSVPDATYTSGATGLTLNNGSALSRTGYTFAGWKNLAGTTVSGSPYVASDNVTLYAIWTPKTVAVTYDKGIATTAPATFPSTPVDTTFGANFTLGTTDTSTVISSSNYRFAGWKLGTTTYKPGDAYRVNAENPIIFVAQWIRLFEVTYNLNGGVFASGDGVNDSQCASTLCIDGQLIELNLAPTRTGFTFDRWVSQTGTAYVAAAPTNVTETNYIFYATWIANSYTITFAAGTGSNGSASAITDLHGSVVQLAASTGYSLTGSIFTGWLIGSTTYPAGAFYTMGTDVSPITATAQYANNTFKVFYNTNGSTGGSVPTATSALTGAAITLNDATGFSRDGYTFDGWSNGTDILAAGFAATMGSANSTLVAQWKIAIPVTPAISSVAGTDGGAVVTVAAGSGGGAPASYTVTSSPAGGSCTIIAPATSCSVSPLTNGTAYTFSVTATNSTGTSGAAASSAITPAGKPDAPTGVSAAIGNGSATVTFVAPANTGGPAITGYTVTSSPAGATCTVGANATTYSCTGLTNGTEYTFAVVATNGINTSDASTASLGVTPATLPGAPTSVTATSGASGSASVAFTAPTSNGGSAITGYIVTSSPAGATCVVGANATTYTCTGLTDGTAYTFAVVATNAIGNSLGGSSAAVTPQGAASAVTTISAVPGDSSAVVTFSGAVANGSTITGYTVQAYDSTGNAVTGATCTVTTAATGGSCTVSGLTNGSEYTFKAVTNSTANSTAETSTPSIASLSITPAKAPDAPTGVTTTAGTGKVTVGWTAPADNGSPIISYAVQAYDSAGNAVNGAICVATAPTASCDVSTGLVAGSSYTFKVTATSAAGTSAASTASTSASINAAPSAPRNVTAVKGNTTATVSWDAPLDTRGSDITGYTVTAYTSGNVAAGSCTSVAPIETCVVTGLTNGVPYTFKVTATNGIGTSAASDASLAAIPSTVPNAPTGVTAASGDAQATITFVAPLNNGGSSVTGYTVTASDGSTISGTSSPLTITGLTNGTAYTFTVKASNANGDSVASTASLSATPVLSSAPVLVTPGQPTGNPYVGSTLTSNVIFSGSPTPTITFQWKVCTDPADLGTCTNIPSATSASYVPTVSELGQYIVVAATATNTVGNLTETSNPTLIINPEIDFTAPSPIPGATAGTAYVLSLAAAGGVGAFGYTVSSGTVPAGLTVDPVTGQLSGTPTTAGTYTFTVRATDSNGVYKDVVVTIVVAAATAQTPITPAPAPEPTTPAPVDRTAADRAAADALAKAAADKAVADAAAAAKIQSDAAATTASTNANTAAAAAAAAKAAVEKAVAAEAAKIAADAAAVAAAAKAKAASDAQAAANRAAAAAAAELKNSTATAAAKAAVTASARAAAAEATAAVKAAAKAAQQAAAAKNTAANANKQVDIAINSLNSKTAASQASAQANAIAAAAKAAANEAAAAAEVRAVEAKTAATAAQRAASSTAARIATEQKEAATAAALAKIAADAATKATAEKIATANAAKAASEALSKVLEEKAVLAEQASKATSESARAEIQAKIKEVDIEITEAIEVAEEATEVAEEAATEFEAAAEEAAEATEVAEEQAAEAVAVKSESIAKTAVATKAAAAATVAAKVATAAKAAAAKVPSRAVIKTKPSTSTKKNSATATVTGLKPGQKVKVTVNVRPRP